MPGRDNHPGEPRAHPPIQQTGPDTCPGPDAGTTLGTPSVSCPPSHPGDTKPRLAASLDTEVPAALPQDSPGPLSPASESQPERVCQPPVHRAIARAAAVTPRCSGRRRGTLLPRGVRAAVTTNLGSALHRRKSRHGRKTTSEVTPGTLATHVPWQNPSGPRGGGGEATQAANLLPGV